VCRGYASESCTTNRQLRIECSAGACDNRTLQRRAFRLILVRPFVRQGREQWGAFMAQAGRAGDVVEEYVGEAFTWEDFMQRYRAANPANNLYFCALAHGVVLDATHKGSYARFINHHCQPNAELQPWSVGTYRKLAVTLVRDVDEGEEVTFSYDYEHGEIEQECWCGAPTCTGKIHRLPRRPPPGDEPEPEPAAAAPSPPAPPTKRARAEVGEGGAPAQAEFVPPVVLATIVKEEPGSTSETAVLATPVKQEPETMPTDAEVLSAMQRIADDLERLPDERDSGPQRTGRLAWMSIQSLLGQGKERSRQLVLSSVHADNVRAFLCQKGPPFLLPPDIHYAPADQAMLLSPESQSFPLSGARSASDEDIIDLTDSPPPVLPRLDAGDVAGGVREEGSAHARDADADEGGEGVGGA